jgi:hypothetical protein
MIVLSAGGLLLFRGLSEAATESAGVVELLQIRCGRRNDDDYGERPIRMFRRRLSTSATAHRFVDRFCIST